jgi:hypothetical protein
MQSFYQILDSRTIILLKFFSQNNINSVNTQPTWGPSLPTIFSLDFHQTLAMAPMLAPPSSSDSEAPASSSSLLLSGGCFFKVQRLREVPFPRKSILLYHQFLQITLALRTLETMTFNTLFCEQICVKYLCKIKYDEMRI